MALVGEFPGLQSTHRRTIRSPANPYDKATIVSIFPKHILERKPTIQPGTFEIKPGTFEKPSILVVGPSSWWREIDESQPLLEIPTSSIQIADSVVRDYANGLLACNMGDQMPGLFYLPGELTVEKLKKEYMPLLEKARDAQRKWFYELVKIADVFWSSSNGNPRAISEDARLAARELNLNDKPWLTDTKTMQLVPCVACGNLRNPQFPICQTCKAIVDKDLAAKLNLTFAQ